MKIERVLAAGLGEPTDMEMSGEQRILADRQTVWNALNDPEILRRCIPGCQELVKESETAMTALAVVKVGPISARFHGRVTLSELDPPNGYRISGEGQGGVAGHARGGALVRLTDDGDGTLLTYDVSAQIGGKLAQLGGRMIDATARSMAGAFFRQFAAEIADGGEVPVDASAATAERSSESPAQAAGSAPMMSGQAATMTAAAVSANRWFYLLAGVLVGALGVIGFISADTTMPQIGGVLVGLALVAGFLVGRLGIGSTTIVIDRGEHVKR